MASDNDIAIVGMAVRLPGAHSPEEYWHNLRNGVESVRFYTDDELLAAGVKRDALLRPNYVKAGAPLERMEHFDAEFFGFSPKEAAIMDPQHRQFLEACWEALEDAGHMPERFDGAVGVFAGSGMAAYFAQNLITNPELVRSVGMFLLRHTGNDKDFLATRASYLLDLRGPAINVQTACSTSLVAAHLAVQHLLSGECDMALAGGVTIEIPHRRGYHYEDGEILSPDGHCRAFDHRAEGTVFGSGTGVIVLRRLQDALDDGDQVYAVIKGTAVNNDGSQKVGYLAPSVDGQAACIAEALAVADVDADSVTYVECHGTGTAMGDPIEVAALTQAFREGTDKVGFCGLGSVKTNIGHLDTAAGVASLVKASLALQHAEIPPTLNYEAPNPRIEFEDSPFYVNDSLREWKPEGGVRRAGVNSLGVGGTNAFAILEEPPARTSVPSTKPWHLLALSGRNRAALDANTARLAAHLRAHPELDLGDVAYTLFEGRRHFTERRVLVAADRDEAIALLEGGEPRRIYSHTATAEPQKLAFMFPGGGAQYPRMAHDLYATEPSFAADVDAGLKVLLDVHGIDLRPDLFCAPERLTEALTALEQPSLQLPAIFIVEHALAKLLIRRGLQPTALIGHSVGENTAACVAGTMRFEDCLGLVVLRGRLMDRTAGGMLAVPLASDELQPLLDEFGLDLAAVNAPDLCVASGDDATLARLEARLASMGVEAHRVKINIAAHSRMLDPVLDEFGAYLRSITLSKPKIPWVSNRTGTWVTDAQATDPQYWVDHLRGTVRFADGIATLAVEAGRVFLEVGPGKTLSSLARMNPAVSSQQASINVLRHADEVVADDAFLLGVTGRLWAAGGQLETAKLFDGEQRLRVSLPTYAFQGQKYFIEPGTRQDTSADGADDLVDKDPDTSRWFWEPVWRRRDVEDPLEERFTQLVFADAVGVADQLVPRLRAAGHRVVVVRTGDSYACVSPDEYRLAPEQGRDGYDQLLRDLTQHDRIPDRVLHLALLAHDESHRDGSSFFHRNQELGFYSLLFLAQAWSADGVKRPLHVLVATSGMQRVNESDHARWPDQATVLGPAMVMPREIPDVTVSVLDVSPDEVADAVGVHRGSSVKRIARSAAMKAASAAQPVGLGLGGVVDAIEVESRAVASGDVVAVRAGQRWVADVRRAKVPDAGQLPLRQGGAVLVTGGLGGISMTVARRLAERRGAKLVLLSRSGLPPRDQWDDVIAKLGEGHALSRRIASVREVEALGGQVEVMAGDVTDVVRMREVVAEMRSRLGGVHGVVHAAGVVNDGLMATKRQSDVEDVLSPKVAGTLVLEQVTADDDLDLFVVFSSTSTVTAPMGQVDYVAANAFLNAFAQSRHGSRRTKFLALDWGIWNEVGMAAEAAQKMVFGASDESVPCTHPWFTQRRLGERGAHELFSTWSPDTDWLLHDHRTANGDALVPGAGYLEIARAALAEIGVDRAFELRELVFFRPLAIADGTTREVRTRLVPIDHGYSFELAERVEIDGPPTEGAGGARRGWRRTGSATILLLGLPETRSIDIAAIEERCATRGPRHSKQEEHLRFGPRWQVVSQSRFGAGEAIARLHLPDEFHGDLATIGLHPALVDLGTGFAMDLIEGYTGDRLWVPIDYEAIGVHGHLPADLVAHVRVHGTPTEASGFARFDVTLADTDGRVLVEVREFAIKRLDGELDLQPGGAGSTADVEFDHDGQSDRHLSKSELVFQHTLRQGILPDERALSAYPRAQVIVSSVELPALVAQTAAAAAAQATPVGGEDGASFARPDLDSEYVAPRDGIEEALVEMWQELLGVSTVGVLDSFFDLGGHSLIAVRLFSKVRKQFSVDFPISVLFEAPTVEACANLIRAAIGTPAESSDGTSSEVTVADRPRFKYLVPMHTGGGGPNLPFFLVAGMFGNVLNLRHLANQIGGDRPFYGVQARGLYGGDVPHETFEEMATDYLQEIRTVQPHGPYLLGGFSGGGIAALEMARQLREVGEETILLAMLDTPLPQGPELTKQDKVQMHLQNLKREGVRYPIDWVKGRLAWREVARRRKLGIVDESAEGELHSSEIEAAFYRAIARYQVRHHPGTVTLFRPKLSPTHVFGPDRMINRDKRFIYADNGWTSYSDRVDVFEMPGDHDSMVLEPNVRVLAAKMRDQIVAAEHAAMSLSARSSAG
ncbi:MAG: SDR family NAD(P)-dependent oxidoreductase [Actinobacteria bacterium]|nr:SDR family NAD(P)-dependent oxidoreductase [Actinomycetota bacterium]